MGRPRKGEVRQYRDVRWPLTFHASRRPIIVEGMWLYVDCTTCRDPLLYDGDNFPYVKGDDGAWTLSSRCHRCKYVADMLCTDKGPMSDKFKWMVTGEQAKRQAA